MCVYTWVTTAQAKAQHAPSPHRLPHASSQARHPPPPRPAKLTALRWPSPQVSFAYIKGIARNASLRLDPPLGILTVTHDVHRSPIFPTVCRNKPLIHPFLLPTNTWAVSGLGRHQQGCSGHLCTSLCGRLFSFLLGKGFGSALLGWRVSARLVLQDTAEPSPKALEPFCASAGE